ncbi:MAG: peptidylprolyl isomerase [Deltaproteobacteria bacterium]
MALIGKIRKNSWILIVLIALGMGGFVLQDIMSSNTRYSASSGRTLGKVNGINIDAVEFSETESVLYSNATSENIYSNKANLWNYFKNKALVESIAKELGVGVSNEELMDLQFGQNVSPIMQARYADRATGQIDRKQLEEIKKAIQDGNLNPEYKKFWAIQENEIIHDRMQTKMNNMVSKAIYTPSWYAEDLYMLNKTVANFKYVKVPFEKINDKDVEVKDSDIEKYISKNKKLFTNLEETRIVKYLTIPVTPSVNDFIAMNGEIEQLRNDFAIAENDSLFAITHNGNYSGIYYKRDELPQQLKSDSISLTKGKLIGPYSETDNFTMAKIVDIRTVPDSVKASHILRSVQAGDANTLAKAKKTIDSLKVLLETGRASFDSLARKFSQDPGSAVKGGDLGVFAQGRMVPEFNDVCFLKGTKGKYYSVTTQFGVHLIYIKNQIYTSQAPKYKVAYVSRAIEPSQETQDSVYLKVSELISNNESFENLEKQAKKMNLEIKTTQPLKENDFVFADLGAGSSSRDIVKWAFDESTDVGDIAPTVYSFNNKKYFFVENYLIAVLDKILPEGLKKVDEVRKDFEMVVRNELKGKKIAAQIKNNDLNQVANQFQVNIDTANQVLFETVFINNLGNEPKVLSYVFNGEINKNYGPIVGNTGVFVVNPTFVQKPLQKPDILMEKKTQTDKTRAEVGYRLINELSKNVKIEDNRRKFF